MKKIAYQEEGKNRALLSKGKNEKTKKIIEKAIEFRIPIFQNEVLAEVLLNVELKEDIDMELYNSLGEVFIWLYKTEQKSQLS